MAWEFRNDRPIYAQILEQIEQKMSLANMKQVVGYRL